MSSPNPVRISQNFQTFLHGFSGATAGTLALFILYPFENIKTRMQVKHLEITPKQKEQLIDESSLNSAKQSQNQQIQEQQQTIKELIQQVLKEESFLGFYKGMSSLAIGSFLSYGVYFFFYELSKQKMKIEVGSLIGYSKAAFLSGFGSVLVTTPFWVISTRMTAAKNNEQGVSFFGQFKQMIEQEGFKSLFKGLSASIVLLINPIIQFLIYEKLKIQFQNIKQNAFMIHFLSGAVSKMIATFLTFPIQFLRTHQHLNKSSESINYFKLIKQIIEHQGFTGLFVGLKPKLVQTILNSAFMLAFYEKIFRIIRKIIQLMLAKTKYNFSVDN